MIAGRGQTALRNSDDDINGTALGASYAKIKARKHFSALYGFVPVWFTLKCFKLPL